MTRVICLPLDDRPVNYDYPRILSGIAGIEITLPPRDWLGNPWRPSHHAELIGWLEEAAASADAAIIAVDTLAYGGLIPSRTSADSAEDVLSKLAVLRRVKADHPSLEILASSVILRISRADSAEEEKPYWAVYGSRMFRLSFLEHKSTLGEASDAECTERDALRAQIPQDVYDDYRRGRERNHAINRAMLGWLADGVFDYLLFPQDDTADYGWNIAEARALQAHIRARGLSGSAITYPGADEIGCLLLARAVCRRAAFAPRVWPRYSSVQGAHAVTAYEDRPVHELLKAHLAPLAGSVVETPQEADLQLFINAPAEGQGTADLQLLVEQQMSGVPGHPAAEDHLFRQTRREMTNPRRSIEEFVRALKLALGSGKPVALADVAFVNGADLWLGRLLMQEELAPNLAAYGAWNTAGNTLGTVLAHAAIWIAVGRQAASPAQHAAHLAFLVTRILDDYFYQSLVRTQTSYETLPELGVAPSFERLPEEVLPRVEAHIRGQLAPHIDTLRALLTRRGLARDIEITDVHLPWQRLFEVGFNTKVTLQ